MNDIRHFINIITESYKHYPDSNKNPSKDYLLPKRQLGGFTPRIDTEFDDVLPDDLKDMASYMQLSDESVDDPELALLRKEIKQTLWTAVARLKPIYARTLTLVFREDQTFTDIAKDFGLSQQWVGQIFLQALRLLKKDPVMRNLQRLISQDRNPTPMESLTPR
jgi:RNA polymerase sigma factor (sigma-70 family)